MGLLDELQNRLLRAIVERLSVVFKPFKKLVDIVLRFFHNVKTLIPKSIQFGAELKDEIVAWKKFNESIPFRTGVVNLPKAIEQTQALIDELVSAYHAVLSVADLVRSKFRELGGGNPTADAEEAIADIEQGGFKNILDKFPKLAKGAEKALAWVGLVADVLENLIELNDELLLILKAARDIRVEVETGSTIFLSQRNRRQIVPLREGGSIKIRVGSLHSE